MFTVNKDNIGAKVILVLVHVSCWLGIMWLLSYYNVMQFPEADNIIQWDAGWYHGIVKDGYWYADNAQSNIAFFPLFPLTWKALSIAPLYMALINLFFFVIGFIILSNAFSFNLKECLIVLSVPSLFFCYVPFSEAFFFVSVSILLYGFQKNNYLYIIIGLLLSGLCRATSMLFLLAFFFIEFSAIIANKQSKKAFLNVLLYIIVSVITVLAVAYIQYTYTGRWFDFLFAQKFWNKAWQIPKLPLTTWDGARLLWLDGTALLMCFAAIAIAIKHTIEVIINKSAHYSKPFLFAIAYLIVIGLVTLFYSNTSQQTSIYSLNRYVFATPFVMVFIIELRRKNILSNSVLYTFAMLLFLLAFLFGITSSQAITLGGIALFILYSCLYFAVIIMSNNYYLVLFFYLSNMILQLKLLDWYLNGKWVG